MPQNQKTPPRTANPLDRPLNAEEEKMLEAWAMGEDQVSCYRAGYGAEGYSLPALKVRACRKFAEPHMQAHMRALRGSGLAKSRLTIEERVETELAFAQRAEDAGNFGAAGGAHDRVNKLLGHYVEKFEDVSRSDPLAALQELARIAPDAAKVLAQEHGIQLEQTTTH